MNLSAAPYACRLATGYNRAGAAYDIEVLSMATFDLVDAVTSTASKSSRSISNE